MEWTMSTILALLIGLVIGIIVLLVIVLLYSKGNETKAKRLIKQAEKDAEKARRDSLLELKEESYKLKQQTEKEIKERKEE